MRNEQEDSGEAPSESTDAREFLDPQLHPMDGRLFAWRMVLGSLILIFIAGAWCAMQRRRLAQQDKIVDRLAALGAVVIYDNERHPDLRPKNEVPTGGLLTRVLGGDPFRTVVGIRFTSNFEREAITLMNEFPAIRLVVFDKATKQDLDRLAAFDWLEVLEFHGCFRLEFVSILRDFPRLRRVAGAADALSRGELAELAVLLPDCEIR